MSERTIWALTSGQYSDWTVHALFETKQLAEKAVLEYQRVDDGWHRGIDVIELTLYGEVPEPVTKFEVQEVLWDDGSSSDHRETVRTNMPWDFQVQGAKKRPTTRFYRAPLYKRKGGRLEVFGTDRDAVMKAYHDRRAQWQAKAAGL